MQKESIEKSSSVNETHYEERDDEISNDAIEIDKHDSEMFQEASLSVENNLNANSTEDIELSEHIFVECDQLKKITEDADEEIFDKQNGNKELKNTDKHRRTFNLTWLETFPWLKYSSNNDKNILLCESCIKHHDQSTKFKNSPWIKKDCVTIRLDKIRDHNKSQMHTAAIAAEASLFRKNEEEENSKSFKAVLTAMKCMEFLVKHNLPHVSLFEEFINFAIDELESPLLKPL